MESVEFVRHGWYRDYLHRLLDSVEVANPVKVQMVLANWMVLFSLLPVGIVEEAEEVERAQGRMDHVQTLTAWDLDARAMLMSLVDYVPLVRLRSSVSIEYLIERVVWHHAGHRSSGVFVEQSRGQ